MSKRAEFRFMQVGQRLREIRQREGLSQADLASRCGLTHADISRMENGKSNPTIQMLIRVLEALKSEQFPI